MRLLGWLYVIGVSLGIFSGTLLNMIFLAPFVIGLGGWLLYLYWTRKERLHYCSSRLSQLAGKVFGTAPEGGEDGSGTGPREDTGGAAPPPLYRKAQGDKLMDIAAAGEAAFVSTELIRNVFSVNRDVYDACSHLAGRQLESFSDLRGYLDGYAHTWHGGLSEHALANVQGHVAEQMVGNHLERLGHHVVFPAASNHPGYDMLVDGHPFNVKDVTSTASLHEHFRHYPHIPVIANHDMIGIHGISHVPDIGRMHDAIAGHENIVLDQGLEHDQVVEHVAHATDGIGGHIPFRMPWFTICLSSVREARLLLTGKTTIANSAKNIGIDAVGIKGGAVFGAKCGASVGAFAGVFGVITCGIAGTILGVLGGKRLAAMVKCIPLKKAKARYDDTRKACAKKADEAEARARAEYDTLINDHQARLAKMVKAAQEGLDEVRCRLSASEEAAYALSDSELGGLFRKAEAVLREKEQSARNRYGRWHLLRLVFAPSDELRTAVRLGRLAAFGLNMLEAGEARILSLRNTASQTEKTTAALEVLAAVEAVDPDIVAHLERLKERIAENRNYFTQDVGRAREAVFTERAKSIEAIRQGLHEIEKRIEKELVPFMETLKKAQEDVRAEIKKLGMAT